MSEKNDENLDITYKIPVERFQFADELKEENKALKKKNRRIRTFWIVICILGVVIGLFIGTLFPLPISKTVTEVATGASVKFSTSKIETVMKILENNWYFADTIDNLETRLTDQALSGLTSNSEDIHTEYMSEEEITSFTQSINRDFVGIGVQFKSSDDGVPVITNVYTNSPAESAGVQAGDIIYSVDGTLVEGLSATEIKELVQGEEGTVVTMEFIRNTEIITIEITRGLVGHTVDSSVDGSIGTLYIVQFGDSTAEELKSALDSFEESGVNKLVIDLRSNGGGYLDALQDVCSLFLPKDTVFITREYSDGTVKQSSTTGGMYTAFSPIVILVNENTASAAEAFTLALSEQREDVTVIGTTTYGKGTVQVTQYFSDGSAIKYTDSVWKSPNGVWINDTGITPDEIVELDPVLNSTYEEMAEEDSYTLDSVSEYTKEAQLCLSFLGYDVDRKDGYFDESTLEALHAYEADNEIEETDVLDNDLYMSLITSVVYAWSSDESYDSQMTRAKELLKESEALSSKKALSYNENNEPGKTDDQLDGILYEAIDGYEII